MLKYYHIVGRFKYDLQIYQGRKWAHAYINKRAPYDLRIKNFRVKIFRPTL